MRLTLHAAGRRPESRENRLNRTTIRDVAAAVGVAPSTISNYFHHPHKLSGATQERVQQAVDALGFVPNGAARNLRTGTNPVIGYLTAVPADAGASETAHAIEQRITDENLHLLTAHGSSEQRERSYLRLFEQQRVAGIIIAPVGDVESELARIRTHGIPSVVLTRRPASTSHASVSTDHALGGRIAVQHLVGQGRKRLGFLTADLDDRRVRGQLRSAVGALGSARGMTLEVFRASGGTLSAGLTCAEAIVRRPPEERPDGLFCTDGTLAIAVSRVLADGRGTRSPLDVAIVGYDATPLMPLAAAPVTAVRIPYREMGLAAVNLLLEQISHAHHGGSESRAPARPHVQLNPEIMPN